MILLPNVVVEVNRSRYLKNSGQTSKPQPYLSGVMGNLAPMTSTDYMLLSTAPEPALRSNYVLSVDTGTDIITGDVIS